MFDLRNRGGMGPEAEDAFQEWLSSCETTLTVSEFSTEMSVVLDVVGIPM